MVVQRGFEVQRVQSNGPKPEQLVVVSAVKVMGVGSMIQVARTFVKKVEESLELSKILPIFAE